MGMIIKTREQKTVFLTKEERKLLKAKRKQFHTDTELSLHLNIAISTLKRIMELGRGKENNINTIKSAIV